MKAAFWQRVAAAKVVDGDTIDVQVDYGWGLPLWPRRLRLAGIDAPETQGPSAPAGLAVSQHVESWLAWARQVSAVPGFEWLVCSLDLDKYGRSIGDLVVTRGTYREPVQQLTTWLCESGLVRATSSSGRRPDWSAAELLAVIGTTPTLLPVPQHVLSPRPSAASRPT